MSPNSLSPPPPTHTHTPGLSLRRFCRAGNFEFIAGPTLRSRSGCCVAYLQKARLKIRPKFRRPLKLLFISFPSATPPPSLPPPLTMLSRGLKRSAAIGLRSTLPSSAAASLQANRMLLNSLPAMALQSRSKRTWTSDDPEKLQKMTEQALIHDISLHQMETVKEVVPWFLNSMPVCDQLQHAPFIPLSSLFFPLGLLLQPSF
jgi:hypothetical protein